MILRQSGTIHRRRPSAPTAALLLAGLLTATGALHFLAPAGFEHIVPSSSVMPRSAARSAPTMEHGGPQAGKSAGDRALATGTDSAATTLDSRP